jgi:nucleoside-diphosphate-sugar epimerase
MHTPFFLSKMSVTKNNKKQISVLGCGWFGLPLATELVRLGHNVKGSTTSAEKVVQLSSKGIVGYKLEIDENEIIGNQNFFEAEILFITIPPKRSSNEQHTFISKICNIVSAISNSTVKQVIFISSTAIYGDENSSLDESSLPNPGTESGKAILACEKILQNEVSFTTTILRFAGLIGPDRNPGNFFANKKCIPNGRAPVNLVHLNDCVNLCLSIMANNAYGRIYNCCCPDHPQKQSFYTQASIKAGLPAPEFLDELLNWKTISNTNANKYLKYDFEVSNWNSWLNTTGK